jgi:hypothetical protein
MRSLTKLPRPDVVASLTRSGASHRVTTVPRGPAGFVWLFVLLTMLCGVWAFASPLMSAPDEPAHTIKAASSARGQLLGVTGSGQGALTTVVVPEYVAKAADQTCYAFRSDVTAACAPEVVGDNEVLVDAETSAGNYNPIYYVLAGLPSLFLSGESAFYAMRLVSAACSALFLALTLWGAARLRSPTIPLIASALAMTPMVLFLSGSINPNALEIVTCAAFFVNLAVAFERAGTSRDTTWPLLIAAVSGALLANTRALSLLWLLIASLAVLLLFGVRPLYAILRSKVGWIAVGLLAVGCVVSLAWVAKANSFASLLGTPSDIEPGQAFATMVDRTFAYVNEYIGVLGWLDTPLPLGVFAFWHFAMGLVLLLGLSFGDRRGRIGIAALALLIVLLPAALQAQVIGELGYIWQGRYILSLVVVLLIFAGIAAGRGFRIDIARDRRWMSWLIGAGVVAHTYAFVYVLRRYTVGLQPYTNWSEMLAPAWQPPLTWPVITLLYLAFLILGALGLHRSLGGGTQVPGPTGEPGPSRGAGRDDVGWNDHGSH